MNIGINARLIIEGKTEGIGNYTKEIVARLVEILPQHTFYLFFDREPAPWYIFDKSNVNVVLVAPQARHPVLWYAWFEYRLVQMFKKWNIHLFFSPENYLSLKAEIPQIMTVHDLAFHHFPEDLPLLQQRYLNFYFKQYLKKAKKIIAVSEFTKKDIVQTFSHPPDKIEVIHNGVKSYKPYQGNKASRKQKPYFIYIGSIHPRKNIDKLVTAFSFFKEKYNHVSLVLLGRWAWKSKNLRKKIEDSELSQHIIITEYVPEQELNEFLQNALALIYPSKWEGFGMPILEAMQYQVPVLCSDATSLPEIAGEAALYFNPYKASSIFSSMEKIYLDTELQKTMIALGQENIRRFDWDLSAKKTAQVIQNALKTEL